MRKSAVILFVILLASGRAWGWSHQGHILLTRLAALRIIDDPTVPAGLRDFLKANMSHTLAECESLATTETVGGSPQNTPYNEGLGKWATMPDQVRLLPEGSVKIEPYGQIESQMHFCQLEAFSPDFQYRDDLSGKPDVNLIPHDLKDPRWPRAGYVPWRVEEFYLKLSKAFDPSETTADTVANPDDALKAAGYLAHYCEDSCQPHHATVDYKSVSYLVGNVPGMPASTNPSSEVMATIRLPRGIDPHGDLEYRLFDDANPPRKELRQQFWKDLTTDITALAIERKKNKLPAAADFDPFRWDLQTLSDSYDYLPFIGHAAQAAYASGEFNPGIFFNFTAQTHGQKMSIIQLIALQNAKAVLNVEEAYRMAWELSHPAAR